MTYPTGKGYFIWQLTRCEGNDPLLLAEKCRSAGISWIALKFVDGMYPYAPTKELKASYPAMLRAAVAALRECGISVWGWGYTYGGTTLRAAAEAQAAVDAVMANNLDGWFIDAESEYEKPGGSQWAVSWMGVFRGAFPLFSLGLCAFRFPTYHREFPWDVFLTGCNFHAPQVYWEGAHNPASQLRRSVSELRALKDCPIIPIGSAYSHAGWEPTILDINDFDAATKGLALPGVGWWSYQHAEARAEWFEAIAAHVWSIPVVVNPPVLTLEERVTNLEAQAVAHGWTL